jgi:acyl-homoserine lactone acylase PvdQ
VDSAQAAAATLYQAWRETYRAGRAAARAAGDVGRAPAAGAGNTAGEAQDAYPSFRALEEVVAGLRRDWGTIQVPWTDLARLQRPRAGAEPAFDDEQASVALAGFPGGSLFVLHTGSGAGRRRYAVAGTAAVLVVEFTDPPRAASVVVFGQSADRTSPHYFDQAPLYAAGELKGVGFGAAAGEHGGAGSGVAGRRERYHPGARARVLRETPTR